MDAFNDPSLVAWRSFGDLGFRIVIWGLIGEVTAAGIDFVTEKYFKSWHGRWKGRLKLAEVVSGAVLIGGLAMEYRGHKRETRILDSYNAQSYERAESNAVDVARLNATNSILRLQLATLINDRTISDAQEKWIDQTLSACRTPQPVWVVVGQASGENLRFAKRVREILNAAGFGVPPMIGLPSIPYKLPMDCVYSDDGIVTLTNPHSIDTQQRADIEIWDGSKNMPVSILCDAFAFLSPISDAHIYFPGLAPSQTFVFVSPKPTQ